MSQREGTVTEFHKAFGHPVDEGVADVHLLYFRLKLMREELKEVAEVIDEITVYNLRSEPVPSSLISHLLKELADLQYVLSGSAVAFGLPLQEAFTRVHRSNMSKLDEDGKPIYREDGKVLKGPNYAPPMLDDLVVK